MENKQMQAVTARLLVLYKHPPWVTDKKTEKYQQDRQSLV
jgi:hypothetical protein